MIFDNIKNAEAYYKLNDKFQMAFDFIKKAVEEDLEKGKYELDGTKLYAMVQGYDTKVKNECVFEGHQKYIDIQYIIDGFEVIEVMESTDAPIYEEYNCEKDYALYKAKDNVGYIVLGRGDFGIFYPQDLHSPGKAYNDIPCSLKKIVVKVAL